MNYSQKARLLKLTLATLQSELSVASPKSASAGTSAPTPLTVEHINSSLAIVQSVLTDKTPAASPADSLSAVDIAGLILQILQLILANLPVITGSAPAPAPKPSPAPAISITDISAIGETIIQILELLLAQFPPSTAAANTGASPKVTLSPVDIAGLILQILQLVLSKFGTQTPAPTPAPAPSSGSAA